MNITIRNCNFNKPVHMIGINGISMSGLAEILMASGYKVTGSDPKSSERTDKLSKAGAQIYNYHDASLVEDAGLVVYTAAVKPDHPERIRAKELNIPIMDRATLLGMIMAPYDKGIAISGTHGKTTTTAMVSKIFLSAGLDPTIHIGAYYGEIDGTVKTGGDKYFITEADEYCESFLTLYPHCAIITNIDFDHADYYKDINAVKNAFIKFCSNVSSDGFVIYDGDCTNTVSIEDKIKVRKITFGLKEHNQYRAVDIKYTYNGCSYKVIYNNETLTDINLKVTGEHNVTDSLAAFACAYEYNIPVETIKDALSDFNGTNRRFEYKGNVKGARIYDDYAHHPTEIRATLKAASLLPKNNLWCVFQPHTYTRTLALSEDIASSLTFSDRCIITDIYAAREKDTGLIHSSKLLELINAKKQCSVYISDPNEICEYLENNIEKDDIIIFMGAGDIDNVLDNMFKRAQKTK